MTVLNFDIYSQFFLIEDFCLDVLIKKILNGLLLLHVHMWFFYYRPLIRTQCKLGLATTGNTPARFSACGRSPLKRCAA